MSELRALGPKERRAVYRQYYAEAFPANELRPLSNIEAMTARGDYHTLGLYSGGEALAYTSLMRDGRYVLIDYLCVPPEKRNRGCGGALLCRLREAFPPDTVFLGESEAPVGDAGADEMILRRLEFYRRCGARILPYDVWLFGVHYRALAWCGEHEDLAELCRRHAAFYRRCLPSALYARMVRIPFKEEAT